MFRHDGIKEIERGTKNVKVLIAVRHAARFQSFDCLEMNHSRSVCSRLTIGIDGA